MRHPTTIKRTARDLGLPVSAVTSALQRAGHIHRDPQTDAWRASPAGTNAGTVIEQEGSYRHPGIGVCLYPKVLITAEGRRWLKENEPRRSA